jgi:hypothetical protein
MDAYKKAQTLHQDVSLGNMILYRPEEDAGRVGYLVDWELSCEPGQVAPHIHGLIVRLIFFAPRGSPDPFEGDSCVHVHRLAE